MLPERNTRSVADAELMPTGEQHEVGLRTRLLETPRGMLTITLQLHRGFGITAFMTLYGSDGWNVERRDWSERMGERGSLVRLADLLSEWTGLSEDDAEYAAAETVTAWRLASYHAEVKSERRVTRLVVAFAAVGAFALFGLGAAIWLIVSALT
jgi:hypothetical protein